MAAGTFSIDSWLADTTERRQASPALAARASLLLVLGAGLLVAGYFLANDPPRFWHAYLLAVCYFASLSLGGLFAVAIMHLTGARWGVVLRRLAEFVALGIGTVALLFVPIALLVLSHDRGLYEWNYAWGTDAAAGADALLAKKSPYLNAPFFVIRAAVYFALWYLMALYFYRASVRQDRASDNRPMSGVRTWSGPAIMLFALTISMASFDWIMSLAPTWFSTIFGVYYFAGSAVGIFALLTLAASLLQSRGVLTRSITADHYHDLGKFMFGFTFFWGYIAFSQYMLYWYANIPEETQWYAARQRNDWTFQLSLVLLFGHLFIPFLGMMSRAVRRNRLLITCWAVYMLVMHWVDLYYMIMPELGGDAMPLGLPELLCTVGAGAMWVAGLFWSAAGNWLLPVRDPRLPASLAFQAPQP